jgi:DMSO/TMAO reductase YedYZ molybdopterin-dependent catalytic subunit
MHRRAWLESIIGRIGFAGYAAGLFANRVRADDPSPARFIVRNQRPLDLESPAGALDSWLTSSRDFFVRSHFGEPAVGLFPWTVEVAGLVERPLSLSLEDLKSSGEARVISVLQCAGNGRAYFRPNVPGVSWERGAVGQAEWIGVRLADVLRRAGIKPGAAHIHFLGNDAPPAPKTPPFLRSIPLEKALHADTLLATRMNGEPLPILHGGPVRLVVPGWAGNAWIKWVRWMTVSKDEAPGVYMQTGYRMPRTPAPPDAVLKPADLVPVTSMNVKSLIVWPQDGSALRAGRHEIRGVAWTGEGVVERVDIGLDRGQEIQWRPAGLIDAPRPWAWRRWQQSVELEKNERIAVVSRATDSTGQTQPELTPYNRSGYLWNGFDRVLVRVS